MKVAPAPEVMGNSEATKEGTPIIAYGSDFVPDFAPLPMERYDVSNTCKDKIQCLCCPTTRTMTFRDSKVIYKVRNCCWSSTQTKPYANLMIEGRVVVPPCCPCPYGISSDFNGVNPNAEKMAEKDPTIDPNDPEIGLPIIPGCGCQQDLVRKVVDTMNERRVKRGNMSQMVRLEYMTDRVLRLSTRVPIILISEGGTHECVYPPKPDPPETFEPQVFNVSTWREILSCGMQYQTLTLEQDTVQWTVARFCGHRNFVKKREYVHLEGLKVQKQCLCYRSLDSALGPPISPGCGCEKGKVLTIAQEIRKRMSARGAVGQMRRQENIYKQISELEKEMPKLVEKMEAEPPTQVTMDAVYGAGKMDLAKLKEASVSMHMDALKPFDSKSYDVTNKIEACCLCFGTCGCAGCTKTVVDLQQESMSFKEANNFDNEEIFLPYAEMESVDVQKECCCCFSVNDISPGVGCCNGAVVNELAADLQARKVRRGNIAQIQQLEQMEATTAQLDFMVDLMLKKEGIAYPPSQAQLAALYPRGVPSYIQKLSDGPQHVDASQKFDTKEYNVSNYVEMCGSCTCRNLVLDAEEVTLTSWNPCSQQISRSPYANVDSLDVEQACGCFAHLPDLADPGCGCSKAMVQEISDELNARFEKRGDAAQLRMQENVTFALLKMDLKTDLLAQKRNVTWPPTQETMQTVFGAGAQDAIKVIQTPAYTPSVDVKAAAQTAVAGAY
jgi:hypothetical protein